MAQYMVIRLGSHGVHGIIGSIMTTFDRVKEVMEREISHMKKGWIAAKEIIEK